MAALLAALVPGAALAQPGPSDGAETGAGLPVTLVVQLSPGSTIDDRKLQTAIARELGVLVVSGPGAQGGTLIVRQDGEVITVSFDGPTGRHDRRTIALEAGSTRTETEISLVAVNVVRDQTGAFRVLTTQPTAEEPAPPPPAPVPVPLPPPRMPPKPGPAPVTGASACLQVRSATRALTPVGVDFLPYVGTSSFEAGRSIRAASIGALGAASSGIGGIAMSGLVNVDSGPVCGAEVAGLINVAPQVQGVQIGGVVDVAAGDSSGLQVGLVDVAASRWRGLQLGLVDVAGSADAQLGLVEVAGEAKVQVGLVNVASDADVQVGLISVDLHGRTSVDAWTKPEAGALLVGVKHGPPHMHSIYAFEMNAVTGRPWGVLGLGAHLTPSERLSIDVDVLHHVQTLPSSSAPNELSELRVVAAYGFANHVSAFVGPTFNVLVAPEPSRADAPGYASLLGHSSTTEYRAWPGVALGVEVQ